MIKKFIFIWLMVLYATACNADFIKVTLLGTGSPRPSVDRFGPAVLVEVGGKTLLFDAGRGVVQRLQEMEVRISDIQQIFLTHLHSDHISAVDDIWLTGWIYQRPQVLNVYGPRGTVSYIDHLKQAYSYDVQLRNQYSGLDLKSGLLAPQDIKPGVIYSEDGVKVTAFLVNHKPVDPAYGYRIDFGERSVVISGDTSFSQSLIDHSKDVDLLVHEIMAAKVLNEVKPKVAVMTHVILVGVSEQQVKNQIEKQYDGRLYMGEDLMGIEVGSSINLTTYTKN